MVDVVRYKLRTCKDCAELGALHALLASHLDRTPHIDPQTHSTLVVCAEVAIEVGHLAAAQDALARYFQGPSGVCDQFLCRGLLAKALLHHHKIKNLKGKELVSNTVEGISHILKALKVAAGNNRYAFLVYNGSVHYWHISRPLQREGWRKFLLESQQAVVEALEQVPGQEQWKVRNKINLALCYAEASQLEDAIKALDSVGPLEARIDMSLKRLLYKCRVHIGCVSGKLKGALKFDDKELTALGNVQMVKSGNLTTEEAEKLLLASCEEVDPTPDGPSTDVPLNVVAAIGWAAVLNGITILAKKCATRAAASQDIAPRAWATLTEAQLAIFELGDQKENLTKSAVDTRIVHLATCARSMSDFLRVEDVDGVQESCRSMWNAGLPLLQDNLRHHIKKPYASACGALATISSPLHKLRAQFHLEVAKCDAIDELVLKARDEAQKGLALDYVVSAEDAKKHGLERPLDRHLEPIERGLTLRTCGTDECQCVEDEILLLIERAKEASSRYVKEDCLRRAMHALELLPLTEYSEQDGTDSLMPDKLLCRKRFLLWGSLIKCAWSVHLEEVVKAAAPHALRPPWNPDSDKEMVVLQVEVGYLEAEACVLALKLAGAEVMPPQSKVELSCNEKGTRLPADSTEQLRATVLMSILQAMQLASAANEMDLVSNGGICAWNYYKPLIEQWRFSELRNAMSDVLDILMAVEAGGVDPMLLCDLAEAHLKSLEHQYLLGVAGPLEETMGGKKYSIPDLLTVRAAVGKQGDPAKGDSALIDSAMDLGKRFSSRYSDSLSQELIETISRIESLRGDGTTKEGIAAGASRIGQFVGILSSLGCRSTQRKPLEDLDQIRKAIEILKDQNISDCEMWSKLSRACVHVSHFGEALDCAGAALKALPEDIQPESILCKNDCRQMLDKEWHWLAVAELVMGQAMVRLLEGTSQEKLVEIDVKKRALAHFVLAMRFSSFIHAMDLMDNVAVCSWNLAKDFLAVPGQVCILLEPLMELIVILKSSPIRNMHVQVGLSCMVLQLHLSQGSYQEGLDYAHAIIHTTPKSAQRPLIPYKIRLLKMVGMGVKEEMAQVMEYELENQAFSWSTFADLFENPSDQLEARRKSLALSTPFPYLHAHCRLDYAEWLHMAAGESEEAGLITLATSEKSGDGLNDLSLVQKCDVICRCQLLLYRIAKDEQAGFQHLMTAHEACLKVLIATLENGCAGRSGTDGSNTDGAAAQCAGLQIPGCLTEWITFRLSDAAADRISGAANGGSVLCGESKILLQRFGILLDVLIKELQAGGLHLQCIPILQLHLIFAKCAVKCEMLFTMVNLSLASTLQRLGLSGEANFHESRAGKYWEIGDTMLDALHSRLESQEAVPTGCQDQTVDQSDPGLTLHRLQFYEFLLFVGKHLVAAQKPTLAKPVLMVALEAARAHDDRVSQAPCLAHLAECELLLGHMEKAVSHAAAALGFGGDVDLWEIAMYTYVRAAQESNASMEWVEKTIKAVIHSVCNARSKDKGCRDLDRLEAFLVKCMGDIKIAEFTREGKAGIHQCALDHFRMSFELQKRHRQIQVVDAAAALCHALSITPSTAGDRRPLLREQKTAWEGAEEVLATISARADPGIAFDDLTLPSSRALVQVRLKLADIHLQLAKECRRKKDQDAASRRPKFKKMPGKDTAVIERYLDSMLGVAVNSVGLHVETSLLLSGKAANGTTLPCLKAPALAMTGDALLFQAYGCCPDSNNPWSVDTEPKRIGTLPVIESGEEEAGEDVEKKELSEDGKISGDATENCGKTTVDVVDAPRKDAAEKAKKYISQAAHLYKESLELSAGSNMKQAQQSAYSSVLCFGQWDPHCAAEHLCLSQSYRVASMLKLNKTKQIFTPWLDPLQNRDLCGVAHNNLLKSHALKIIDSSLECSFASGIKKLSEDVNLLVVHLDPQQEHVYLALIKCSCFNSGEEGEVPKPSGVTVARFSLPQGKLGLQEALDVIDKFDCELQSCSGVCNLSGPGEEGSQLYKLWEACVETAEGFFSPVLDFLEAAATPTEGGPPVSVIVLADVEMDTFPFESFSVFKDCASVSRDFSLALLMSRCKDEANAMVSDFKYIVEPKWCQGNKEMHAELVDSFKNNIADQYGQLKGLAGTWDCPTAVEEAQELLVDAKSFMYHGNPSFLGFMSPLAISSLDLSQCRMALLLHRDSHSHPHDLMNPAFQRSELSTSSHNRPYCMALLLSVCGTKSVTVNRMPLREGQGINLLQGICQNLSTGSSIGQATRYCWKEDQHAFGRSQLRVYGIPTLTAVASGKGGKMKKKK